jgi:hypothetical protein
MYRPAYVRDCKCTRGRRIYQFVRRIGTDKKRACGHLKGWRLGFGVNELCRRLSSETYAAEWTARRGMGCQELCIRYLSGRRNQTWPKGDGRLKLFRL